MNQANSPTTLDLHGVKHQNVDAIVENFVLKGQNQMPLEIIYGNSTAMQSLVISCLERLGLIYNNGHKNQYGRLLVTHWKD